MTDPQQARLLVTAALPYANGPLHLGHMAGAYLPADIYCRYQRLMARELVFICGSDEHGVAIMLRARQEGITPNQLVDRYHPMLRDGFEAFGMSFDHYGRTSSPKHHETSQDFFRTVAHQGAFIVKTESQLYDPEAQLFLADRFVRGTCPTCGYTDAYGDQCERCGRTLSPKELIDPRSAITQARPELRETAHWYLPLGQQQNWLEQWIDSHPNWKPNVVGQAKSWLKEGLTDRSMTRDSPWGVPVPREVAEQAGVDAQGKVLYVWFDAPIGYISATREWAEARGDAEGWKRYWQQSDTKLVHFIGKDNIVFHCVVFPTMLKVHGGYVLPDNVPANEFLNLEGQKLSTSRGWAVWVHEALQAFPPDCLRYAVLGVLPETKDSDFSWKEMQARVNNELADTLGNFVNRTVAFAHRFLEGRVPPLQPSGAADEAERRDREMQDVLEKTPAIVADHIEQYRFREAGAAVMTLARQANKYFNDSAPWSTRSNHPKQCAATIHIALQVCASLSILCEPFLPFTAQKIRTMLGLSGVRPSTPAAAGDTRVGELGWNDARRFLLSANQPLNEAEILFRKIEDVEIESQLAKLRSASSPPAAAPSYAAPRDTIQFSDFEKLDLRVGSILSAEPVPKSKKLLRCQVDLGFETRQVLAGIAEHLKPADIVGKKVVVVANLAPRKMLGLESQGMLLMAKNRDGQLVPATADGEPGATVS
jgi:methionyl-tRNA synthetase